VSRLSKKGRGKKTRLNSSPIKKKKKEKEKEDLYKQGKKDKQRSLIGISDKQAMNVSLYKAH
jgi:MarR-like DNA-binding transcriptional regulator SgrR of sgrS sRNA